MADIFRTVKELLESSDAVTIGNAVHTEGYLYADSVENLYALQQLERPLRELVEICVMSGIEWDALAEVIELIGGPYVPDPNERDENGDNAGEAHMRVWFEQANKASVEGEE